MTILKKANDLRFFLKVSNRDSLSTGFIPTMGALHEGHISLIRKSKENGDLTICSIFINPAQFNDPGDYQKYPVTIENDILLLEQAGCDILFLPSLQEIYPKGTKQDRYYELGDLEKELEGRYRPGHFQAVCMVIDKLLQIIPADRLYLGRKDYQQCLVIKKLLGRPPGNLIQLQICETVREEDGLAMSSRNMRLDAQQREKAPAIYRTLQYVADHCKPGLPLLSLKNAALDLLVSAGFKPEYVEIADAGTLAILSEWNGEQKIVALIAAFLGDIRLIDNLALN